MPHDTADNIVRLDTGTELGWTDTPLQFRHYLTPKRLLRLVRTAETVKVIVEAMQYNALTVQKTALIELVKTMPDTDMIACEFDGFTLVVLGVAEAE